MSHNKMGRRLVVVGAGIGGCFAAAALANLFDEVLIIERDVLPADAEPRRGVPQGAHIHGILRRPLDIAIELFPGFEDDLRAAGSISLRVGSQLRFFDGGAWQPRRDLGFTVYSQTRALLEHVIRNRVLAMPGLSLRASAALKGYQVSDGRVVAVELGGPSQSIEVIPADLVVDATGRGGNIVGLLKQLGYGPVESTELGVDICYASALFTRSDGSPDGLVIRGNPPNTRSGVLFPIEHGRWVISLSGRFGDFPKSDDDSFADFARSLEDPSIHDCILKERRLTNYSRFLIPRVYWRRYERMASFPRRLIPIGDAVAGFNPVYGQGMAVAALQAAEVASALRNATNGVTLDDLTGECLRRVAEVTKVAWNLSEPVDLALERTAGVRPADFEDQVRRARMIRKAIDESANVHRAFFRVANLLDPAAELDAALAGEGILTRATV